MIPLSDFGGASSALDGSATCALVLVGAQSRLVQRLRFRLLKLALAPPRRGALYHDPVCPWTTVRKDSFSTRNFLARGSDFTTTEFFYIS